MRIIVLLISILFLGLSSCATVLKGSIQRLPVESKPQGARVKILNMSGDVESSGVTPYMAELKRGRGFFRGAEYKVIVDKAGYKPVEFKIHADFDVGFYLIGNFCIGGFLGWLIIDPMTGAMWNLRPDRINVDLGDEMSMKSKDTLTVVLLDDVPAEYRDKMVPIN